MSDDKFKMARFKKNSYPIIENEPCGDFFFIIREGKVHQNTSVLAYRGMDEETLDVGDFFGVISCMSRRPRLYSVETIEDSVVIIVHRNQFDLLIQKNAPVALKILRYFSNKLRILNGILTQVSLKNTVSENPSHLYDIGEYYNSNQMQITHAAYAFLHYLKHCPTGQYSAIAKSKLSKIISDNKNIKFEPEKIDNFNLCYHDGQIVFLEHEPGDNLYIIQTGEVKIYKIVDNKEVLLNILKNGDIFGEMAILENRQRNATAIASSDTRIMSVSKENFATIVTQHPQIATRIITLLSDRIWFIHRHISNIHIDDPETRLYDALYIHLLKARVNIEAGGAYTFHLSFNDLLKFSGLETPQGVLALRNIISDTKNFSLIKDKIVCNDIKNIEGKMNMIKRNVSFKNSR